MGGKGSGKKSQYFDEWHINMRLYQREYYERNRDAINLGKRLKISKKRARKLLRILGLAKILLTLNERDGKQKLLQILAKEERIEKRRMEIAERLAREEEEQLAKKEEIEGER